MRIATIQFDSRIGAIAANFSRAESLLMREEREGLLSNIDLLVLPELAFTGYNHPSLSAIAPYLEPTADGPSTRWAVRTATRLKCTVAVGYPEASSEESDADVGNYNTAYDAKITGNDVVGAKAYNSLVFVSASGDVVAHHRKAHLFYTDETWACEGGRGFYTGVLPVGPGDRRVKVAAGICMDVNPYKFQAPFSVYEFATVAKEARAKVVVLSCAWNTYTSREDILDQPDRPDMDTINYWINRLFPLLGPQGSSEEVIVVFANRRGFEGANQQGQDVTYAGSSTIMGMRKADDSGTATVKLWDMLGSGQDGVLIVDTDQAPKYTARFQVALSPVSVPGDGPEQQRAVDTTLVVGT